MVYSYSGILFNNKKEQMTDKHNMNESWKLCWEEEDRHKNTFKKYILYEV